VVGTTSIKKSVNASFDQVADLLIDVPLFYALLFARVREKTNSHFSR
jgi:hypothetical protein